MSPSGNAADTPVHLRSFEALFRHSLAPKGELLERLRRAGYDPDRPKGSYPTRVYKECLDIARRHLFGELAEEEGWRRLGHVWVSGFEQTVVGKVLAAAARMMGTDRCLARLPTYVRAGREDHEVDGHPIGPRAWRIVMKDPHRPLPHLTKGVLEAIVRLTGQPEPAVTLERVDGPQYELHVRW